VTFITAAFVVHWIAIIRAHSLFEEEGAVVKKAHCHFNH